MMEGKKVEVTLPPGIDTPEQLFKMLAALEKQRFATQVRDKAVRGATKRLIEGHKPEYDKLLAEEVAKVK